MSGVHPIARIVRLPCDPPAMHAVADTAATTSGPGDSWLASHAPPAVDLTPLTPRELDALFRGGEPEADDCERLLVWASRARGAFDLAVAEGLDALRRGDRLATLGYHLDDYAREVLGICKRTAETLAHLGRELRTRPLLREALRSGRVRLRAAETVLQVATGEAEAQWVERAGRLTVRQLEDAVRRGGGEPGGADEPWLRLRTHLSAEERLVVDEALDLARELAPGSSRTGALEALAQEFLGECPTDPDEDDPTELRRAFRAIEAAEDGRRAALEAETERWAALPAVGTVEAPGLRLDEAATAHDVDARLRELTTLRARWDDLVGWCAHAIRRSRLHLRFGFADFRQYCEERLQLPARTVEQRARLEERLWASAALREARRQKLSFEKLRLLATLADAEIGSWTPRAHALTCIALKRALEGEKERRMLAQGALSVPLPRRIAALLAAAIQAVRSRVGQLLPAGKSLAVLAWHFLETWSGVAKPCRTPSRKVRERDAGQCQVPGCSHGATHSHHVDFRSHGGGDEPENQVAVCAFHHLRCIHGGYLQVTGRAPAELTWWLDGKPWTGRP
jgi:hypothetical protein